MHMILTQLKNKEISELIMHTDFTLGTSNRWAGQDKKIDDLFDAFQMMKIF